jgi:hypothetical protein
MYSEINGSFMKSKLLLATGTAGDRAAATHKVDSYNSVTYTDMLSDKLSLEIGEVDFQPEYLNLDLFPVASDMSSIPGVNFYQYDFTHVQNDENELNFSWSKFGKNPTQAQAWFNTILADMFGTGDGMMPSLEEVIGQPLKTVMMFMSNSTTKPRMKEIAGLMEGFLSKQGWRIFICTGEFTTGDKSEGKARKAIKANAKEGYRTLILSAGHIGSRSFSIPSINCVILAYDNGSAAATGQKMSRTLTRDDAEKVSNVVTISIDPSRDDTPISGVVLETAMKRNDEHPGETMVDSAKHVLRSLNTFNINKETGQVAVDIDEYTAKILSSRSLSRTIAQVSDVFGIMDDAELIQSLMALQGVTLSLGKAEKVAAKGKTFLQAEKDNKRTPKPTDSAEKALFDIVKQLKLAIQMLSENAHHVAAMAGTETVTEGLNAMLNNSDIANDFNVEFGIPVEILQVLVDNNYIPVKLLDLTVYNYAREEADKTSDFWASAA